MAASRSVRAFGRLSVCSLLNNYCEEVEAGFLTSTRLRLSKAGSRWQFLYNLGGYCEKNSSLPGDIPAGVTFPCCRHSGVWPCGLSLDSCGQSAVRVAVPE